MDLRFTDRCRDKKTTMGNVDPKQGLNVRYILVLYARAKKKER